MKILLIGANGQLGKDLLRVFTDDDQIIGVDIEDCDITKKEQIVHCIASKRPDAVINTAAWTDVPGCESNDRKAFELNALGAKYVALACHAVNCKLMHISTDYVFDGEKNEPYTESDTPAPINVYGLTKYMAELYIRYVHPQHFIVRTSGLYGIHHCVGKKTNFVETMLRLGQEGGLVRVVNDERLAPTFTLNLARQLKQLIRREDYGLYHAVSHGSCSWFEFARKIFDIAGMRVPLEPISVRDYNSPVRRPANSTLQNKRLQSLGIDIMNTWEEALEDYFLDRRNKPNPIN